MGTRGRPRTNHRQEHELKLLPPVLRLIADATSIETALTLAEHFGGTMVCIGEYPTGANPVVQLIGIDNARAIHRLIRERGIGDGVRRLTIPKAADLLRAQRNADIVRAFQETGSKPKVARRFGITTRTVRKIVNAADSRNPFKSADRS